MLAEYDVSCSGIVFHRKLARSNGVTVKGRLCSQRKSVGYLLAARIYEFIVKSYSGIGEREASLYALNVIASVSARYIGREYAVFKFSVAGREFFAKLLNNILLLELLRSAYEFNR